MMRSGERLELALEPADGSALGVEWDEDLLRGLGAAGQAAATGETPRAWQLEREPDWERTSALRLISAVFDDGALLGVAALRPRGTAGHDADAVAAFLVSAAGDVTRAHEALLSTEYGPDGTARRLGLELYQDSAGPPVRIVADSVGEPHEDTGAKRTALTLRMEGTPGTGLHELVHAGAS